MEISINAVLTPWRYPLNTFHQVAPLFAFVNRQRRELGLPEIRFVCLKPIDRLPLHKALGQIKGHEAFWYRSGNGQTYFFSAELQEDGSLLPRVDVMHPTKTDLIITRYPGVSENPARAYYAFIADAEAQRAMRIRPTQLRAVEGFYRTLVA